MKREILVIEDDRDTRDPLETNFQACGWSVSHARSSTQALVKLHASTFDLVVLDLNLPGGDGLDVCRSLRRRDIGRMEVTGEVVDAFEFRTVTLRQLKTARQFMHDGSFTRLRDVVHYFNEGMPVDDEAAASGTLAIRFTHPRGPGFAPGLGLDDRRREHRDEDGDDVGFDDVDDRRHGRADRRRRGNGSSSEVDDLVDFLDNALFDPALLRFDPSSTTRTFALNEQDLTYSLYRPDVVALGAVDGRVASGLPPTTRCPGATWGSSSST